MKYLIVISVLAISLWSCSAGNTIQRPDNLISKEKFIDFVTEVHIADAMLTELKLHDMQLKDSTTSYYNYVFVKHGIDRQQFENSLRYYSQTPQEVTDIWNAVLKKLEARKAEVDKKLSSNQE